MLHLTLKEESEAPRGVVCPKRSKSKTVGAPGPKASDYAFWVSRSCSGRGKEHCRAQDHSPGCSEGVPAHSLDLRGLVSGQRLLEE